MSSTSYNPGRVAGCLYLLLGFSVFRPIYVAGTLIVREDATATARNIAAHEQGRPAVDPGQASK